MTVTITEAHLAALRVAKPALWAPLINAAIVENDIREVPDFLSNILHESARLGTLRESMNYTAARLTAVFGTHITKAQAAQYGRIDDAHGRVLRKADEYWIAELAYGGRLGNAPPGHGDGWAFRGVGPMQNTGRANIEEFGETIGWAGSAETLALRLAEPEAGMQAAGAFWKAKACDSLPTPTARRVRVNGGQNGLAEVLAIRAEILRVTTNRALTSPVRAIPNADNSADDLNARSLSTARNT